jgi:hypothetical protein
LKQLDSNKGMPLAKKETLKSKKKSQERIIIKNLKLGKEPHPRPLSQGEGSKSPFLGRGFR